MKFSLEKRFIEDSYSWLLYVEVGEDEDSIEGVLLLDEEYPTVDMIMKGVNRMAPEMLKKIADKEKASN